MNCSKPYILNGNAYGCGQCVPCRVNKRREWTHRMMLECSLQKDNAFLTLTYAEENLPSDLSVRPQIISNFIKRLRKKRNFRYFAVGEYGDSSFYPHYHAILFGFPTCAWGLTRKKDDCCPICTTVKRCWTKDGKPLGHIMLGSVTPQSMAYVAGYVTKKMTSEYDPRLEGRRPEFARMSLRPGIGYGVMHEVASTLLEFNLHRTMGDVPHCLQHGSKKWPLGRYLRRSLRCMLGKEKNTPQSAINEIQEKMRTLREAAFNASEPLQKHVLQASEGRRIQIHAKQHRSKKVTI